MSTLSHSIFSKSIKKVVQFGSEEIILETGKIARQATASVLVSVGGVTVLVTVVGNKRQTDENRDFLDRQYRNMTKQDVIQQVLSSREMQLLKKYNVQCSLN